MFEELIKRKKPVYSQLVSYGFIKNGDYFQYSTDILNGTFALTIQIGTDDTLITDLLEKETGEAYILYKTKASGAYVGEVRAAIGQVICDIVRNCYETAIFKTLQALVLDGSIPDEELKERIKESYKLAEK